MTEHYYADYDEEQQHRLIHDDKTSIRHDLNKLNDNMKLFEQRMQQFGDTMELYEQRMQQLKKETEELRNMISHMPQSGIEYQKAEEDFEKAKIELGKK